MDSKGHVAINMTGSGSLDVALAREEALHRFRDINWATYTRAGGFSLEKAEITALMDLEGTIKPGADDTTNVKAVDEFMSDAGPLVGSALLKLVKNVTEPTVLKYCLARMEELLPDGLRLHKRMVYFVPEGSTVDAAPFLRMIRNDTGYLQYAASHLLALFLTIRPRHEDAEALCQWEIQALKTGALPTSTNDSTRANVTRAAVASLMVLLRNEKLRVVFVKLGGVLPVVDLLESSQNRAQLAYELTFILWTLAFCDEAMEKFVAAKALDAIVQQVAAAPREKVVRVALEALQNLLGKLSGFFNERMIDSGLLKTLNNMRERKWADEDIAKGIQAIRDVLIREYKELNTMERYEKELRTGTLNWGLLHTDKFWKDNFMTFENKDFELIRLLIDLLESDEPKTVAVALFDLGEFVRFYPNGKHIAKRLGAKKMTMKLMTHENAEVQKQALQCISKMMVNKWEFVK
ncbi:V-type proton ATPase subunit H, putative [Phytophthora infestans T30-4]|uniref:V-type proton ATPase subunit H n=1 Tax=Phytophthora infestans (strain T30-4) TaxID=403677 RepID=D0MRN0_PHYIT|nr:V-type proton ATPase subunit H, putative [Phytophthora infestans T30-4]EEY58149.1 V-type proton ATPase subunit H, putative [Phytophthora infestans T30-4]|eukprot:XP_002909335.1 V-type proton ATPase subunit H, putative [Phytophthora infestans T30-4]